MTEQDASLSLAEVTGTLATRGYNLIRKLGEGTYAKVYLATYVPVNDPSRKSFLACKVVDTNKATKDFVRKFLPRELDILMKINHPHIVHVHSIFQRRSKYYIFMRLAEKGDLLEWVLRHGAVAEGQSRVWLRQLALAIQYLQALDVAHRDLKCENVLITANYNVKLADFGFARYVVDARGKRVLSGTNCGSLSYAAPEILRGEHYDPRISDIWSLGVVLYIMLNKAMPFDDTDINRLYDEQIRRRWKFCSNVVDTLSEQVKKLVFNMLEPEVTKRWSIEHILGSEWLAMDPRLATNTTAETAALASAVEERQRRYGQRRDSDPRSENQVAPLPTHDTSQVGCLPGEGIECYEEGYQEGTITDREMDDEEKDQGKQADDLDQSAHAEIEDHPQDKGTLQVQPSHGAISIMETEPMLQAHPPHFLPADLTERLLSSAPSRISKKLNSNESRTSKKPNPDVLGNYVNREDGTSEQLQHEHAVRNDGELYQHGEIQS